MAAYKDEARGTWYVSFHYNDWTGKNKRKLKRGFRTRKEALEYEQKFLLQQATNLDMRFADFYKLYEEDLKPKPGCQGIVQIRAYYQKYRWHTLPHRFRLANRYTDL